MKTILSVILSLFLAISAFADLSPESMANKTAVCSVTDGTGMFAPVGAFKITFTSATTYRIDSLTPMFVSSSGGSCTWLKTNETKGTLTVQDSVGGRVNIYLTFYNESTADATFDGGANGFQKAIVVFENPKSKILNLSNQLTISGDEPCVVGFVCHKDTKLLIRAVGEPLKSFGIVDDCVDDPHMTFYSGQSALYSNDDWNYANHQKYFTMTGAFNLPIGSKDSVIIVTAPKGAYTVHVKDLAKKGGRVLVEVYFIE